MKSLKEFILSVLFIISFITYCHGQNETNLPYKGGAIQFDKDVATSLIVEAGDSARIYFVEIRYSSSKKEIETILHGVQKKDITAIMVETFFRDRKNKWDKQFLKTSNIVIPLFISPKNIDKSIDSDAGKINIETFAKIIAGSFKSKRCYLYKPVYFFDQNINIDAEPQ